MRRRGASAASCPAARRRASASARRAGARERRPFVGRARPLRRLRCALGGGRERRTASWSWPASPGSARRGSRRGSPPRRTPRARSCSTGAPTRRASSPYQPFVEALRHYAAHRPRLAEDAGAPAAAAAEARRGWCPSSAASASVPPGGRAIATATSSSRPWCGCCCTPPRRSGCCSSSRTCTGRTSRRCSCCASSLRRGAGSRCSSSRRTATSRRARPALLRPARRPPARGGPSTIRLTGLGSSRPRSSSPRTWAADRSTARCVRSGCASRPAATRSSSRSCCTRRATSAAAPAVVPEGVKDVIGRRLERLAPATLEIAHAGRRARQRLPPRDAAGGRRGADAGRAHRGARGRGARRA